MHKYTVYKSQLPSNIVNAVFRAVSFVRPLRSRKSPKGAKLSAKLPLPTASLDRSRVCAGLGCSRPSFPEKGARGPEKKRRGRNNNGVRLSRPGRGIRSRSLRSDTCPRPGTSRRPPVPSRSVPTAASSASASASSDSPSFDACNR